MELSDTQRREFMEQGYLHVANVVPPMMIDAALRAINHSLGEGIDLAKIQTLRAQSYCPELQRDPVIIDLYNQTPASQLAQTLIGKGKVKPVGGGQIALRFPGMQAHPAEPHPHLDGMYTPTNGVPEGKIASFTMLLGVMLSDVSAPFSGNLAVWPGTHRLYENYFREHGPESLFTGMPPVDLLQPVHMLGKAGDVVLCHYQLAHAAVQNVSPHVRYAIYFRLHHINHDAQWKEAMTNIWLEWDGMQELGTA